MVTPFLDREKPIPMPMFQTGFVKAIVLPLYTMLGSLDGVFLDECTDQINKNLERWRDKASEEGLRM